MSYCIYSDKVLADEEMSEEHIIPLSLGGSNDFVIKVGRKINNDWGSFVDGKFSQDFLIKSRTMQSNSRGHSKKAPRINLQGKINDDPIIWTLKKTNSEVYDPVNHKRLNGKLTFEVKMSIDLHIRTRFASKICLATGYFLWKDLFVTYANCQSLRDAILYNKTTPASKSLRFYDNLHPVRECDQIMHKTVSFVLKNLYPLDSLIFIGYAEDRIIATIFIHGKFIATINFEAFVDQLPKDGNHDLGCVLICHDGNLIIRSFRSCLEEISKIFELKNQ